ncbi:MAG: matrixin family metalloprotease [Prosthecobacter sp.]
MFSLLFFHPLAGAQEALPVLSVPVHVHLVRSAQYPALQSAITEAEVQVVFAEVNRIWGPAGIRFEVKGITSLQALEVAPKRLFQRSRNWVKSALPLNKLLPGFLDVCFIHEMGPNGFYYGEPVVISETPDSTRVRGGSDHPVGRVAAHEIGHALTLQHREDRKCLMAPGLRGVMLNNEEIRAARERALLWAAQGIP